LFLSIVYFKVDIILLSIIEWPVKWDLSIALYSLPMKIIEVLMVVWGFYMTSLLPSLTGFFKNHEGSRWAHLISISFKILFSSAVLIFSLWVLFRDYMIRIIANENYLVTTHMFNSSDAFLVVLSVIVFYFISLVFIYCLVASDNQWKLLKINIIVTIFNIIWNILLIPKYSFIWAWIVTLLSQILLMVLWYFYTRKLIQFHLPFFFVLKNLILGAIIYFIWYYLLMNFSVWLYFDFIVYGGWLFLFYVLFLYFILKPVMKIK
jgi:O-antigen/teichoic acid export membrane protein